MIKHIFTVLEPLHRTDLLFCSATTGTSAILALELFVLTGLLETTLKTEVCPPIPQLSSPEMSKPSCGICEM